MRGNCGFPRLAIDNDPKANTVTNTHQRTRRDEMAAVVDSQSSLSEAPGAVEFGQMPAPQQTAPARRLPLSIVPNHSGGQPKRLRLKRKTALPSNFQRPPLLSVRQATAAPSADGALADAEGFGNRPLRSEQALEVVNFGHALTSHIVKRVVNTACEVPAVKNRDTILGMATRTHPLPPAAAPHQVVLRLEATRMALDLRPVDVCRTMGWNDSTWSNYKNRRNRPALDEMILFSERYGIPLDWIYKGDPSRLPHAVAQRIAIFLPQAAEELAKTKTSAASAKRKLHAG